MDPEERKSRRAHREMESAPPRRQTGSPLPATRWDFLIVGAGIAGLSLAEALVRRSRASILVLEAGRVGQGASTRNAGRLAHAGITSPAMAYLARASRESWHEMQKRIGWSLHFQQLGEVTVFYREEEIARYEQAIRPALRSAGLACRIVSASKIAEIVPGYAPEEAVAGFYSRESYVLHHDAALYGLLETILGAGVVVREHAPVTGFLYSGDAVTGVEAAGREIVAENTVLCCGDATGGYVADLGWQVPVRVERQQMIVTETLRPLKWPIVRWTGPESAGSCHQMSRGEVVAACQDPNGDVTPNDGCSLAFLGRTTRQLFHNLPILRGSAIIRQWGGRTTKTADHFPFAGAIPGYSGAWALFGMNAFTLYPLVAEWLATTLLGESAHGIFQRCALSSERGVTAAPMHSMVN